MNFNKQKVTANNKRIVKNSLLLYGRMFIVMAVSLFTSREILRVLGVDDFGIFNVVGGVVTMMNVVNSAMSVSTQRYLTFEIGKKEGSNFSNIFSMCMNVFILLSIAIFVVGETIGLWFVNKYLVIPSDRIVAANWVYQFSILSCICSLLTNPYNATIIAHERMNVFAYLGLAEVVSKLIIVYLLIIIPFDRLASYGFLMFLSSCLILFIYYWYCRRCFKETKYSFVWNYTLFKQLASYSGWNLFGSLSGIAKGQGLNVLINMFFGPSVNASRGIAYQLNGVVHSFFTNFYTAVRPQITKYYAQEDKANMFKLVFNSSRMAIFLILLVSLPLLIETNFILQLWLGQTPDYAVPFIRLIIIITAIDSMSTPLMTAIHATGNNRLYQLTVGILMILTLPFSYVALKMGYSPVSVFIVSLVLSSIGLFARLSIANKQLGLPIRPYIRQVILRSLVVVVISLVIPIFLYNLMPCGLWSAIFVCFSCVCSSIVCFYMIGLEHQERNYILQVIRKKIINKR